MFGNINPFGQNPDDKSIEILRSIFGVFGDIPKEDATQPLLHELIYNFTTAVLMISTIIYGFIVVVGTINSAKEGNFLGKDWDSYWMPLRLSVGAGLIVPIVKGYCIAQYFVMTVVLMGIGLANTVLEDTMKSVNNGTPAVISPNLKGKLDDALGLMVFNNVMISKLGQLAISAQGGQGNTVCEPLRQLSDSLSQYQCQYHIMQDYDPTMFIQNEGLLFQFKKIIKIPYVADSLQYGKKSTAYLDGDIYGQFRILRMRLNGKLFFNYLSMPNDTSFATSFHNIFYELNIPDNTPNYNSAIMQISTDANNLTQEQEIDLSAHLDTQAIRQLTEAMLKALSEKSNDTAEDHPDLTKTGWWDIDQVYLQLDQSLNKNLNKLYEALKTFDKVYQNNKANQDLSSEITNITLDFWHQRLNTKEIDHIKNIYASEYEAPEEEKFSETVELKKDQHKSQPQYEFRLEMSETAKGLKQRVKEDKWTYKTEADKLNAYQLIDRYVYDGLPFDYAYMIQIMTSIMQTNAQNNPNDPIYGQVIVSLLNTLEYVNQSGVHLKLAAGDASVDNTVSQSKRMLDKIFGRSIGDVNTGILSDIWKIGQTEDNDGIIGGQTSQVTSFIQLGHSMIDTAIESIFSVYQGIKDKISNVKLAANISYGISSTFTLTAGFIPAQIPAGLISISNPWHQIPKAFAEVAKTGGDITIKYLMLDLTSELIMLPFLFLIAGFLFITGVLFAFVIPLMPFILFWAAKVAWLLLVVEAVIAAPIMAMGLIYPEGHKLWGKAQTGLSILVSLIFKPVLFVIGMFVGMVAVYLVVNFTSTALHTILGQITNMGSGVTNSWTTGVVSLIAILTYAGFMVLCFQKCFSPIYLIPEQLLKWIGGTSHGGSDGSELNQVKGNVEKEAGEMKSAGQEASNKAQEYQKSDGDTYAQSFSSGGQAVGSMSGFVGQKKQEKMFQEARNKENEAKLVKNEENSNQPNRE
ncbi:DotA/TraY family protein [Cysteiniphilum sp. JM-1]|uniref:DotA/TraY family protein n=1 Tax=Cysteiniphilum sp. JM-1 TaxID=2610891 RepID=UPI0012474558|nr:DotA/TraY family protein [Cysteiniphilum sp. JM-1]